MTDAIVTYSEYFSELALNELQRAHSKIQPILELSPQHLYIRSSSSFGKLTRSWKHKLPIYLHHMFPVHEQIPLTGTSEDLIQLRLVAQHLCADDFTVQVHVADDYRYVPISVVHAIRPGSNFSPSRRVDGCFRC